MFGNVGSAIKTIAKILFFLSLPIALLISSGIFLLAKESFDNREFYSVLGLLSLIFDPILFFLGSYLMYGFGELIERVTSIDEKIALASLIREAKDSTEIKDISDNSSGVNY